MTSGHDDNDDDVAADDDDDCDSDNAGLPDDRCEVAV